jgi:hypothetical protein
MTRTVAALLALVLARVDVPAQEPSLDAVLARIGAYVTDYQERLAGVVAEETYHQQVMRPSRGNRTTRDFRELKSDVLLVKTGTDDRWLQFRDVFEVDRKPIRDRDERLYQLFVSGAKPDARAQAETIQNESARYNIGPVWRTINIPILALLFFETGNQELAEFTRARTTDFRRYAALAAPTDVWLIEFKETTDNTMVRGADQRPIPSRGRAWVDSVTGRILRTEHVCQDTAVRAVIDVTYAAQAGLDVLVPAEMRESYIVGRAETRIDGRASYGKFRQFTVTTSEKPKG